MKKKRKGSRWYKMSEKAYTENQKLLISLAERNNSAKLLDVGCNDGNFTLEVARYIGTSEIYGIEINEDCAKEAQNKGIKVKICDVNKEFPFENDYFDVVISHQVLEHLLNTDNFFSEIHRVLKPKGYAVISTSNLSSLHSIFFILLGMQPTILHPSEIQVGNFLYGNKTPGHIKAFNVSALKDLSRYHNFDVEKIVGSGIYMLPKVISRILCRLTPRYALRLIIKIRTKKGV